MNGRLLAIGLLAPLLLAAAKTPTPSASPTSAAAPGTVVLAVVDGTINVATADYLQRAIDDAAAQEASALVIQLDTPGGMLESTQTIVRSILGAPIPVIVYVAPSGGGAVSAGVFITLAGNIAAMAPGTNIGAAHPVTGEGKDIGDDMRAKVENFTVALMRSIAEQRGRNVEWAEKAVRESVSITEREAVKIKVVDFIADSLTDLLARAHGRTVQVQGRAVVLNTENAPVQRYEMNLRQRLLNFLGHPNVAYILMTVGLLGLYLEFSNPGLLLPGIAGAICLLLGLAVMQVLPINYTGLALIGLGIVMLIAEVFLPSFGVVGVGGMVAFVLGSLLLFDRPDSTVQVDRGLIAGAALALGGFTFAVGWLVVRSQRRRSTVGAEGMIGEVGEVRRILAPGKRIKVFVHGEYWDADSDEPLSEGDKVEVTAVSGLRMRVRRLPPR